MPGSTDGAYYGARGVVTKGIELQLSGELAEGWQVNAGIARTLGREGSGDRINPTMPTTLATLFTTYRLPGRWHQLTVGGGLNWQNRVYYPFSVGDVDMRYTQGSRAVFSLMARYAVSPQLSLQLNIENLFDKRYNVNIDGQAFAGTPRHAVATLNYKF